MSEKTTMIDMYLEVAATLPPLIEDPAVVAAWESPSALEGFTVGGLAEHLTGQMFSLAAMLASSDTPPDVIGLLDHYGRVSWLGADLDEETNVAIRERGEEQAAEGPASLITRARAQLADLRATLPAESGDRPLRLGAYPWALRLDDMLLTRLMEIAVHSDDLAVSVGIETPPLPPEAIETVADLLTRLAIHRHGPTAVLRALSRSERAPTTISAF
ncbi:maleylpyruvate isomerase N-terminal domain-containing protein [Thermomonospora umbrina]|uniref:Uncharacterized protein (TIGR03083 family) n=1 Tax=Thermomonospora umbrina TaxID=111806 RepID=A0A3D9SSC7_9ACTN|nr:maleylpyruvate isomerase N-terminal domain-containing protein [Thermomonospora umbrina]REE98698.1 uncharacterized protein (TIGR03083 family) [Thermomonospora umbrina]